MSDPQVFALNWIEAWNLHDLSKILSHYSDDFEITTPMIQAIVGVETGALRGKANIRQYWASALEKVPELHFELVDVAQGVESIAIYYKSVMGKMAIEVMFFDEIGKVKRVVAHYTQM